MNRQTSWIAVALLALVAQPAPASGDDPTSIRLEHTMSHRFEVRESWVLTPTGDGGKLARTWQKGSEVEERREVDVPAEAYGALWKIVDADGLRTAEAAKERGGGPRAPRTEPTGWTLTVRDAAQGTDHTASWLGDPGPATRLIGALKELLADEPAPAQAFLLARALTVRLNGGLPEARWSWSAAETERGTRWERTLRLDGAAPRAEGRDLPEQALASLATQIRERELLEWSPQQVSRRARVDEERSLEIAWESEAGVRYQRTVRWAARLVNGEPVEALHELLANLDTARSDDDDGDDGDDDDGDDDGDDGGDGDDDDDDDD